MLPILCKARSFFSVMKGGECVCMCVVFVFDQTNTKCNFHELSFPSSLIPQCSPVLFVKPHRRERLNKKSVITFRASAIIMENDPSVTSLILHPWENGKSIQRRDRHCGHETMGLKYNTRKFPAEFPFHIQPFTALLIQRCQLSSIQLLLSVFS
jgi:hypothetical protein